MAPEHHNQHRAAFSISSDHPALAGHFPGNPVVPGVVILHEVMLAADEWLGSAAAARRLPYAKFITPLRPGEDATIELTRDGASVSFSVRRGERVVAKGAFEPGVVQAS